MTNEVDILFVTSLVAPRDSGSPEIYRNLRLEVQKQVASIPLLRALAHGGDMGTALAHLGKLRAAFGAPPVLTPFYMHDYMARRGLTLVDIPCLETCMDQVKEVLSRGVRLIAISTTWLPASLGATIVRQGVANLRTVAPDIPIVVGGVAVRKGLRVRERLSQGLLAGLTEEQVVPHYLLINAGLDRQIDAVVVSEGGEATLARVAQRIGEGKEYRDLPNLAIPTAEGYRFTSSEPETSDVDGEIVEWDRHVNRVKNFDVPIRTAVGCPFTCEFCDFSGLYRPRQRSRKSLFAELGHLTAALPAPRRVFFTDDNLAANGKRLAGFAKSLIEEHVGLSWRAFLRADAVDEDVAALLAESGCRECMLGIESGDPQVLKNMNKRLDPDRALRSVELLDAHSINTQCMFVVGFPGECSASIERTAALISAFPSGGRARALHRYNLFRLEVLPLCPVASLERRAEFGLQGIGERWSHKTMNSEEAAAAMRDLFLKVQGPSHGYIELIPSDWSLADARGVVEMRDAIQKQRLRIPERMEEGIGSLLDAVRAAETGAGTGRAKTAIGGDPAKA